MNNYNSPINGSELSPTEQNGIMYSESDGLLYKVTEQGSIVPLKSPINGSELSSTEQNGIMYSESDGLLYKVTEQGNIIPLKSPINGGSLISLSSNLFQDPNTLQYFKVENNSLLPATQIDLEDKVEEFVRYR